MNSLTFFVSDEEAVRRLELVIPEIESLAKICKVLSISLGVMHNGRVIFRKSIGLGDVERNLEADSDTAYLIGSCSKMITSIALAMLVLDGKVKWEATIQSHIPTFDPVEDREIEQNAKLLDPLTHSTGLANPNAAIMGPYYHYSLDNVDDISLAAKGMIDWWHYEHGILEFVRRNENVVGLWWQ